MEQTKERTDVRTEIRRALGILAEPGGVIELRTIKPGNGPGRVWGGFFDDLDAAADAAARLDGGATIYVTLNSLGDAMRSRVKNRVDRAGKGNLTGDADIGRRRWMLVDLDVQRELSDTSATDVEHKRALERALHIREALASEGWPAPASPDSGNGGHLLYRVDLPAQDGGLVKRVLKALAERFDGDGIHVDTSVSDAARITKVYGTMTLKGRDTPERPHRRSRLLDVPDRLEPVPLALLQALAGPAPTLPRAAARAGDGDNGHFPEFDLAAWAKEFLPRANGPNPWGGNTGKGKAWAFDCPWRDQRGLSTRNVSREPQHGKPLG